jgi:hypothetical protein
MPKTPRKKAHIIKKLTQSPRTKKVLVSEGILPNDEVKEVGQLFSSLQKSIEKLKPQGTAKKETRVAYRLITRLIRSTPKASKLKKRLGVNRKPVKSAWWNNEMREKKTEFKMISRQKSVTYLSPEVSREVPVKKECVTVVDKSTGLKTKVQKQVMIMTQSEAYKKYVGKFGKKVEDQ